MEKQNNFCESIDKDKEINTNDVSGVTASDEVEPQKGKHKRILYAAASIAVFLAAAFVGWISYSNAKVVSIEATYQGETTAGTSLDNNNPGILVKGLTKKGDTVEIGLGEWKIAAPKLLEADNTSNVLISFEDLSCGLAVACTDSNVASIVAYYDGEQEAGTAITNITEGFHAMATLKDGTKFDITNACEIIGGPIILQADKTSNINVSYRDPINEKEFLASFSVICTTRTVKSISAKYTGEALAGELLDDNNQDIVVTATFNNGDVEIVSGWMIKEAKTLESSQIATVVVSYEGKESKITVECSTVDPDVYRKSCIKVSYNDLIRDPAKYEDQLVKITGRIFDIDSDAHTASGYKYTVRASSLKYFEVDFDGTLDKGNFIYNDSVTCYGVFTGIEDESPVIIAKYIDKR